MIRASRNVFGQELITCSDAPKTGYFRNGCCDTGSGDQGMHTVCVQVTAEFLEFSVSRGNDLSTPRPEYGFPGLQPGDRWCLCVQRWAEAFEAGMAPKVVLAATHEHALEYVTMEDLQVYALDL